MYVPFARMAGAMPHALNLGTPATQFQIPVHDVLHDVRVYEGPGRLGALK